MKEMCCQSNVDELRVRVAKQEGRQLSAMLEAAHTARAFQTTHPSMETIDRGAGLGMA